MHTGTTWPQVLLRELQDPVALMSPSGKADALQPLLTYLCTLYLLRMRNPTAPGALDSPQNSNHTSSHNMSRTPSSSPPLSGPGSKRVMDPVAHFHFGNGALLNTVYWRYAFLLLTSEQVIVLSKHTCFRMCVSLLVCLSQRSHTEAKQVPNCMYRIGLWF